MPYVTSVERMALAKGREEGRQEGRQEGLEEGAREGLRQVRASTGSGSVCTVVEVAPWSRIPETRALFVPRDD